MRPPSEVVTHWYENFYGHICVSANSNSVFNRYLHRTMEKHFESNKGLSLLELGGNRGEHASYVKMDFEKYLLTDIKDFPEEIIRELAEINIQTQVMDIHKIESSDNSYDRIIVTCVFHHLDDPFVAATELLRVAKPGGVITILLPCDAGLLYRFLRRITSVRKAAKLNLKEQLELVHAIEHRNHFSSLVAILKYVFAGQQIDLKFYPNRIRFYNVNAFAIMKITKIS